MTDKNLNWRCTVTESKENLSIWDMKCLAQEEKELVWNAVVARKKQKNAILNFFLYPTPMLVAGVLGLIAKHVIEAEAPVFLERMFNFIEIVFFILPGIMYVLCLIYFIHARVELLKSKNLLVDKNINLDLIDEDDATKAILLPALERQGVRVTGVPE